jgi:hypothetical protein
MTAGAVYKLDTLNDGLVQKSPLTGLDIPLANDHTTLYLHTSPDEFTVR